MKLLRKPVSGITLTLLIMSMLTLEFNIQAVTVSLPVHNIDTGLDYATIQEAINANETHDGHRILVDSGVYYENVVLNKTLSLIGENRDFAVIDANGTGNGIVIQADYSMVENFTIQNGGFGVAIIGKGTKRYVGNVVTGDVFRNNADAVGLSRCDRNIIANNTFESNGFNIIVGWIDPFGWGDMTSNNNTITGNNMTQGFAGISILYSKHNVVSENNVSNMTDKGIAFMSKTGYPYTPIVTNNSIINNIIVNCTFGLFMSGQDSYGDEDRGLGSCNNITGNVIQYNELGVYIFDKGNSTLSNNKVADNVFGMYLDSENNALRGNEMNNNLYNFVDIWDVYHSDLKLPPVNDIDTTNTINGKHIYYLLNQSDLNINPSTYPDMGYLVIRNCINVTIANWTFSNNGVGLAIYEGANITIENVTMRDNLFGISATHLVESRIRNSIFQNNLHGLSVVDGEHVEIKDNSIMNNSVRQLLSRVSPYFVQSTCQRFASSMNYLFEQSHYCLIGISGGIYIDGMSNSTVIDNVISNNERGIYLEISIHNVFKNNTMANNVYNFGQSLILFPREWFGGFPPDPPQISPHLMNDVDASNTVNGKPIYWCINRQDEQVPNDAGYVVLVNCTNMILRDLVLQNNTQGALLVGVSNSLISNNTIKDTEIGICIYPLFSVTPSTNNTITRNNVTRSGVGIQVISPFSTVSNNLLTNNLAGMSIDDDNLTITENTIVNNTNPPLNEWLFGYPLHSYGWGVEWLLYGNGVGIKLKGANITVHSNTIEDNYYGISVGYLTGKGDNKIYHNNFINNTEHVWRGLPGRPPVTMPTNRWDNGYPSGGNYWSNYTGVDLHSGSNQDETGSDSIGDTSYVIDENNVDNYPLMAPFSTFDAGTWNGDAYSVDIVSNSTLSDFKLDVVQKMLSFNAAGIEGNAGFCRVTIPNIIVEDLWYGNYTVLLNSEPWPFRNRTDNTNTYIYINYTHSEHEIIIIPEFPSALTPPLFMLATLVTTVLLKKKRKPKLQLP